MRLDTATKPLVSRASVYEQKTYYELLGLSREATAEEINYAFREISKVYDPGSDFFQELFPYELSEDDKKIFALVSDAYETLSNQEKKEKYDLTLRSI